MAYLYEDAPLATPESVSGMYPTTFAQPIGARTKRSAAKRTLACFKVFKAILARAIFAVHGFVAIWRVTVIKKNNKYYYLCGTLGCLFLETILSVCIRQGEELKWFSPSVFFYLATVCPSVWIMELHRAHEAAAGILDVTNETKRTSVMSASNTELTRLPIDVTSLSESDWLKIFEQALMVILIVGRWLLPKGELTRDQLSQLLLVYIGMAADIIEIFEAFREPKVIQIIELVYTTLALWTWSLMQFTLVLTATKARRPRVPANSLPNPAELEEILEEDSGGPCSCCWWCSADIWGILTTLILQDGPFLCLRLTFLFKYNVVSYSNVFFTIKNSLVIVLQVYRTVVLLHYSKQRKKDLDYHSRNGQWMKPSKSFPERLATHRSFDTISA
ncbi:transmembrane protein 26-like [Paramacrobiotus metropolitanus]|uniref:transmembrane protein 26-like n=1 Tax=Paramacrobiotus metropolitanus TaxID=2943436 RepID=UPI002445B631|nr:transmembrane protein 26-like [Paramacrobiotus metropolitanus]